MVKRSLYRVKIVKQLLKIFPKYDEKKFANVVTGDETLVYYFESGRKVSNKIWATKNSKKKKTTQQQKKKKKKKKQQQNNNNNKKTQKTKHVKCKEGFV